MHDGPRHEHSHNHQGVNRSGPALALLSALLFGVTTPLSKLLLGDISPWLLAGLLYFGSGGGLPIIPCLIARPDLEATLIESSQKKAIYLREALKTLGLRGQVLPRLFEEVEPPPVSFVTCCALDQFIQKLPALIDWAPAGSTLLLFGGESLREELRKANVTFEAFLIPQSEKRFLFLAAD